MLISTAGAFSKIRKMCLILAATAGLLSGCVALDLVNAEPPTVRLDQVSPKQIGGAVQQLELGLIIENPNRFDLRISGVDFTALVNGERFASGSSNQSVIVPSLSEALMEVQVALGFSQLFSQAAKLLAAPNNGPIVYGVQGTVELENWPTAIPFNVEGEYASPFQ